MKPLTDERKRELAKLFGLENETWGSISPVEYAFMQKLVAIEYAVTNGRPHKEPEYSGS